MLRSGIHDPLDDRAICFRGLRGSSQVFAVRQFNAAREVF